MAVRVQKSPCWHSLFSVANSCFLQGYGHFFLGLGLIFSFLLYRFRIEEHCKWFPQVSSVSFNCTSNASFADEGFLYMFWGYRTLTSHFMFSIIYLNHTISIEIYICCCKHSNFVSLIDVWSWFKSHPPGSLNDSGEQALHDPPPPITCIKL